jgi:arsenate reductase
MAHPLEDTPVMSTDPGRPPSPARTNPAAFVSAPPRRVLFLCVHNSARSQIAEGLARTLAPAGTEIWSAGTAPSVVHPLAVEVMAEAGIEISGQRSKTLDEVPWRDADTIVSLCSEAEAECPTVGGAVRRVHWPLDDPASAAEAERLQAFRDTRDELRWRVACLWPGNE